MKAQANINILLLIVVFFMASSLIAQTTYDFSSEDPYGETDVVVRKGAKYAGFMWESQSGMYFVSFDDSEASGVRYFYAFGVIPRYNFYAPKKEYSFSLSSPLALGLDFVITSGANFYGVMVDVPLMFDFNVGLNATESSTSLFGWYLGAGANYNYSSFGAGQSSLSYNTLGPGFHTGFRWINNRSVSGLRFSYSYRIPGKPEEIGGIQVDTSPRRFIVGISFTVEM